MAVATHDESHETPVGKPETAGQKIKSFYDKHDGYRYEAGEVLTCIFKDLEKIILNIRSQNKDNPEYYIVTHSQKVPWLGDALHIRTWWRKSRPRPAYNFDCYKVINPGDLMSLQWCVPSEAICRAIESNPKAYDPVLAECVVKFRAGTLV